jgi:hypothetical protein
MDKVVYIVAELEMANIELANIIERIGFNNICNSVYSKFGDCETIAWSEIADFIKEVAYEN